MAAIGLSGAVSGAEPVLLFQLSADHGTTADISVGATPEPTFASDVTVIPDGAAGPGLSCGDLQRLAWKAPGNIYAQRGSLSFFWRSRYAVGPTEFPIFRVAYADHSSWDMVWLRIDYNGHGFDAFVTDASLARTRVSVQLPRFPASAEWVHLAFTWDETVGVRLYVNGQLAAEKSGVAVFDAALDQFGPHSRIISPHNVQSDYNFVRGGDIDEIRIYDRMLDDGAVAALARHDPVTAGGSTLARDLAEPRWREEWWHRYGWDRTAEAPPLLPSEAVTVRKVEIHDAYDLKRWWWKASDGIRETTWPGVYNRSRLPGRHDYFELPDWDCYSLSGQAITFSLPEEPWNQLEISGAAWGRMELLPVGTTNEAASETVPESLLFERPKGFERTTHHLAQSITGRKIRFTNVEQEQPIGELAAYAVHAGIAPLGSASRVEVYRLGAASDCDAFFCGRFPADERALLVAHREGGPAAAIPDVLPDEKFLPVVRVVIPPAATEPTDGLDGICIDLPAFDFAATHAGGIPFNLQVSDPLWPLRRMCDFNFSVRPGEAHTVWLDLRDRILPVGRPVTLSVACASGEFNRASLRNATVRLVYKPRAVARVEHELDRFTQARDSYAMLVEEHPFSPKFDLWVRFESDLKDLLRVAPDHVLGRQYAAIAMGAPAPEFVQPVPPDGVPLWAFRQVEALRRAENFVQWWIDHRQIANGEFGGGLSDDTDLTNLWPGVALMGCAPDKLTDSIRRELDACYAQGMFTAGLPTIQTDELHSYEEGINSLGQNLILNFGSPRQVERAMETARGIAKITGINAAGHRHIRSSYYSGRRIAEEEPWNFAKSYSYLMLQPAQLLVDYNGQPEARRLLLEIADGLLAHREADGDGKYTLPSAINFRTDANSAATRNYLPWPLFWSSWKWTRQARYLDPIFDGGPNALLAVNANALDELALRDTWGPRILGGERGRATEGRATAAEGRGAPRPGNDRSSQRAHFTWQLTGDKAALARLYGALIEDMALGEFINTEGSLWSDRVSVPTTELQRARLGGVALARNATFPGHTVSWRFAAPATAESVALLLPDATAKSFTVIAYTLEATPVQAALTGWNVDPGVWEITQGTDKDGDDVAEGPTQMWTQKFERGQTVAFTFPPRATTILTFRLKTPGQDYWARPDLGLDLDDVKVEGEHVRITVHSLGSVPAPATDIVIRDRSGAVMATAKLPALAAPLDLRPKTEVVVLTLSAMAVAKGFLVELDPRVALVEITRRNNVVEWPAAGTAPRIEP